MKTTTKQLSIIGFSAIILAMLTASCNLFKKENTSDILEKALTGVVTIKIDETSQIGKSGFGFADSGLIKLSAADEAYASVLNLENAKSTGSGFVIEQSGKKYIVTNAHVIEGALDLEKNISAYSFDRKEYKMKLVGADSYYDIAVLEFNDTPDESIIPLNISKENYRIGQAVYAIGNPLSFFPYTVTQGIISAKNRSGMNAKSGYLQTTAMLSPGNSGGPLINDKGELLGVNTLGSAKAQQLNFSLESKVVERIVSDIIQHGRVKRAFIGIESAQVYKYSLTSEQEIQSELINERPIIWNVIEGSPAEAELTKYIGSKIVAANGKEIYTNDDLVEIFENLKIGDLLKLKLERDGFTNEVEVKTDELSESSLEKIAVSYFKTHYNISVTTNSSGVILNYPSGLQKNTFQLLNKQTNQFTEYVPQGELSYIIACGNTKSLKDMDIWRVKTLKDLGNALRLSAGSGEISFLEFDGKKAFIIRVLISDRSDIISKVLIY
jgi:S1-C subfamily serine protease